MDTTATNKKLREIMSEISKGSLILRPGFQRNLVWTAKHKNNIIRTVLMGYPFPEIFIATIDCDIDTAESKNGIVDGQQRISTLYSYFKGATDFKLENDIKPYAELDDDSKKKFLEYVVVVRDLGIIEDHEIREIFKRLNSTNYNLNDMEVNHAVYDGRFRMLCERLASLKFFENKPIFTSGDIRRMKDSYYIASILSTIILGYFNNDTKIEDCFAMYNESFDDESIVETNFVNVLELISRLNITSKRIYQKADFFTLFIELYYALYTKKIIIDEDKLKPLLDQFYNTVDSINDDTKIEGDLLVNAKTYKDSVTQGTNHRSSRIARGTVISKLIMETQKLS